MRVYVISEGDSKEDGGRTANLRRDLSRLDSTWQECAVLR